MGKGKAVTGRRAMAADRAAQNNLRVKWGRKMAARAREQRDRAGREREQAQKEREAMNGGLGPFRELGKLAQSGCWCGAVYGHDWPGKDDGAPHPR
jgi:hypothetical protein